MEASLFKTHYRNFSLKYLKENKTSLKKYLIHTAVRWRLYQVQWPLIGKRSTGIPHTHIVKGGETLTSIARRYGVSILDIVAENGNLVDIDFVMEGERLNIPARSEKLQMVSNEMYNPALVRWRSVSNIQWTHETQKAISNLSYCSQKVPAGYSLVLVPLMALLILSMIKALQHRAMKKIKNQEPKVSKGAHRGIRADRWRTILDDPMPSDTPDTPPGKDDDVPFEEDHSPASSVEMSHEYRKHEFAYRKFLSECGMSRWGHFRGGAAD